MRTPWLVLAGALTLAWLLGAMVAPEVLSVPVPALANAGPGAAPPLGADDRGVPLLEYVLQGARIVAGPALLAGLLVMTVSSCAAVLRCGGGLGRADGLFAALGELLGGLPRWVVVLVVALCLPREHRSLTPLALTWAVLAAPGAVEEAGRAAERLGAQRFVEALRAHGFSWSRIYLGHVLGRNLRPVVVRQGTEVVLQVVFLEIGLSTLAVMRRHPGLTHGDSEHSWASLLYFGYAALLGHPLGHALVVGLGVLGAVGLWSVAVGQAARAR